MPSGLICGVVRERRGRRQVFLSNATDADKTLRMHVKLLDIENLARGTDRQKQAYEALRKLEIIPKLAAYSPVLAGSIPLDIDIPGSGLDVICSTENLETFAQEVKRHFGSETEFELHHRVFQGLPAVVARFSSQGFPIEIFAQSGSALTQPAVIHMLIEARLLAFAPREAKEMIRALKETGVSTEAAFAQIFELDGDPFTALSKIAMLPDHEILKVAHRFHFRPH